jgi:hypothetical protein
MCLLRFHLQPHSYLWVNAAEATVNLSFTGEVVSMLEVKKFLFLFNFERFTSTGDPIVRY